MMSILFLFPIADFKTVTVPTQSTTGERGLPALDLATLLSETGIYVVAVVLLLALTYLILCLARVPSRGPPLMSAPRTGFWWMARTSCTGSKTRRSWRRC